MYLSISHLYICWDSLAFEDFIYALDPQIEVRSKASFVTETAFIRDELLHGNQVYLNFNLSRTFLYIHIQPLQWEHPNFHVGDWIIVYSFWFLLYVWCCMEQFQDWMLQMFLMPQYLSYGTSILSMLYQKEKGTLLCLHIGYLAKSKKMLRLLKALYHPRNQYLLQLDDRSSESERMDLAISVKSIKVFEEYGNVNVIGKSYAINRMGSSALSAPLHAAALLLKLNPDWDWFITLSASDYPLMTQDGKCLWCKCFMCYKLAFWSFLSINGTHHDLSSKLRSIWYIRWLWIQ